MKTWVLLGASRGLGYGFLKKACATTLEVHNFSRRPPRDGSNVKTHAVDFSDPAGWDQLATQIRELKPERVIYFAGGGPFGDYQNKNWKDHQWAWRVTFECPAFLLHSFLKNPGSIKQFAVIGSSVAESHPDPRASSYSSAKHALKGLVSSVQAEGSSALDVRLFSPGYMDTEMLPAHAWPRQQPGLVKSPAEVAEMLWAWIHNADDVNKHFVLHSSP